MSGTPPVVLLTGATGYIGGRLVEPLLARGVRLRCLARRSEELRARVPTGVEVVAGDVLAPDTLAPALRGVDVAYYLVHSMGSTGDFRAKDREAALRFGEAARQAGVRRVVYLGGLGEGDEASEHLASRHEVGEVLRATTPTLELRASIIIGSGSLSFEMIRALVERLPIMVTPRWVRTPTQPIAVEDVIAYLVAALDHPAGPSTDDSADGSAEGGAGGSVVYEIGGADRVSYGGIMREYARQRGLRRLMVPVPVLTPWLSSLWLGLVTPVYARVGKKLVDGLRTPTVVRDERALREFGVTPRGVADAIARALANEDDEFARTRWSDAFSAAGGSARA
ncbi:MAG: NAD(P)H-binding protein, partial [Gemmatimonadota bacterium]